MGLCWPELSHLCSIRCSALSLSLLGYSDLCSLPFSIFNFFFNTIREPSAMALLKFPVFHSLIPDLLCVCGVHFSFSSPSSWKQIFSARPHIQIRNLLCPSFPLLTITTDCFLSKYLLAPNSIMSGKYIKQKCGLLKLWFSCYPSEMVYLESHRKMTRRPDLL